MNTRVTLLLQMLALCLSSAWTRSVSVSLNMSLTRTISEEQNATKQPQKLNQELLESCMRETDFSMSQLKFYRFSLLFNDNNNNNNDNNLNANNVGNEYGFEPAESDVDLTAVNNMGELDYGNPSSALDVKRSEPLQCFVRCLYERLGLVHYDMILEEAFKMQLESLMQRQKSELKECKNMTSRNRCEAAYKLHLCYNHLKNLETEQRLREMIERSGKLEASDDDQNDNENGLAENEFDKANEILNAMQPMVEPTATTAA